MVDCLKIKFETFNTVHVVFFFVTLSDLRRATIPIFFDMIWCEYEQNMNFTLVSNRHSFFVDRILCRFVDFSGRTSELDNGTGRRFDFCSQRKVFVRVSRSVHRIIELKGAFAISLPAKKAQAEC